MSLAVKKLNKNGFTLVEVTVTLAVFAILVAIASAIVVSGGNIYARNANTVKASQVSDSVYDVLNNRLSFATSIGFVKDKEPADSVADVKDSYSECIKIAKKGDEVPVSINRKALKDGANFKFDEVCDTGAFDVEVSFDCDKIKISDADSKNPMSILPLTVEVYSSEGELVVKREYTIELLNIKDSDSITAELTKTDPEDKSVFKNTEKEFYINYTLAQ